MILVVGAFHQLQVRRITTANARAYARWIARRYRNEPHLVWASYPKAEPEYVPVLRELAAGFREGDEGRHRITVHPDPSPASSSFVHTEPWLAFNMLQPGHDYELIPTMVAHDSALEPPKPVVMAEAGYEGVPSRGLDQPWTIRKQAYWSHLAGGHHSYGHENNYVSPATWREWIHSRGARHMSLYRQILTAFPEWWNLTPDPSILADGAEANLAARAASGEWALVYLSAPSTVSPLLEASWFSPTNGERIPAATSPNRGIRSFTTPAGWEDALLFVEAREPVA